ncbi:MAG: hypothetical protein ACTSYA_06575 [Candidatus Kariarchaeaceae archaeon]
MNNQIIAKEEKNNPQEITHSSSSSVELEKTDENKIKEEKTIGTVSKFVDLLADFWVFIYKKLGHLISTPFRIVARIFDGIISGGKKGKKEKGVTGSITGSFSGAVKGTSTGFRDGYTHMKQTLTTRTNEEVVANKLNAENSGEDASGKPISEFIDRISFTTVETVALKLYMYTAPLKAAARVVDGTTEGIVTGARRGQQPLSQLAYATTGAVEGVVKGTIEGVKEGAREIGTGLESIVHSAALIAKKFRKTNKKTNKKKKELEDKEDETKKLKNEDHN